MPGLTTSEILRGGAANPRGRASCRCLLAATLVLSATAAWGPTPLAGGEPGLLTGDDLELQLRLPTGIGWSSNPLRQGLANLSRAHQVAIFLDRRVDPGQSVDFSSPLLPLWEVFQRLAAHVGAGAGRIGPVVYIGPPETAGVLATVIVQQQERIAAMSPSARRRLQALRPTGWPELSTPRALVAQAAADASLDVRGLEQIPHDLWPAVELPPLDAAQRLGLLLAGFGLTFEFTGEDAARLVPLPAAATVERSYELPAARPLDLAELRQQLSGAELTVARGTLRARATIEQQDTIRRLLSGPVAEGVERRYSLEIQNQPLGPVAQGLGRKLGLEVQFDPRLAEQLETLVSFKVADVTLDKLLEAMLAPANLSYQVDSRSLRILPGGTR